MRVTSARLPMPASVNAAGEMSEAPNGARDSGTSSKPPIAALGGAWPVTVTVCGVSCAAAGQAAAADMAKTRERIAIVELQFDVAGRQTERAGLNDHASGACFPARGLPHSGSKGLSQPDPDGPSTPSEEPRVRTRSASDYARQEQRPARAGLSKLSCA